MFKKPSYVRGEPLNPFSATNNCAMIEIKVNVEMGDIIVVPSWRVLKRVNQAMAGDRLAQSKLGPNYKNQTSMSGAKIFIY